MARRRRAAPTLQITPRGATGYPLHFPVGGLVENVAYGEQPGDTTPECQNVRPFDTGEERFRGGQRAGMARFIDSPLTSTAVEIDDIGVLFEDSFSPALSPSTPDLGGSGGVYAEYQGDGVASPAVETINAPTLATPPGDWVRSGTASVDWTGLAATNESARALAKLGTTGNLPTPAVYVLEATVTTFVGETTNNARYVAGFFIRGRLNVGDNTEYVVVGWERLPGLNQYRLLVEKRFTSGGQDLAVVLNATSPLGAPDASAHTLRVEVAGDDLIVKWDGTQRITYTFAPGDGVSTLAHQRVGLWQSREREGATWAGTDTALFDDFTISSGVATEQPNAIQDINQITVPGDPRRASKGELLFEENFPYPPDSAIGAPGAGDPITGDLVFEDEFTGVDGAPIAGTSGDTDWRESRLSTGNAPGAYPFDDLGFPIDIDNPAASVRRYEVSSNQALCDWITDQGGAPETTTASSARWLRKRGANFALYGPSNTVMGRTSGTLRAQVITNDGLVTMNNSEFFRGLFVRRGAPGGGAFRDFYGIGWRRDGGANTQTLVVFHPGAGPQPAAPIIDATSAIGAVDDGTHDLEVRVNGDTLTVRWDGILLITFTMTLFDDDDHFQTGLLEYRRRDSGTWANDATDTSVGFDTFEFFEATGTATGWLESLQEEPLAAPTEILNILDIPTGGGVFRVDNVQRARVDEMALERDSNSSCGLRHIALPPEATAGPDDQYVLQMKIVTFTDSDAAADNNGYFAGFVVRFRDELQASEPEEQFRIGWRRSDGADTYTITIEKYDPVAQNWTVLARTDPAVATDDLEHTLGVRVNGHFMEVEWDRTLQIWSVGTGSGLIAGSTFYDLTNDGFNNPEVHLLWGFGFSRSRDSGGANWSSPTALANLRFDEIRYYAGAVSPRAGREIRLTAVAGGRFFRGDPQERKLESPDNQTTGDLLSAAVPTIQSAVLVPNMFLVDGLDYQYYDSLTDSIKDWDATLGTLPGGQGSAAPADGADRCSLIAAYRGRIVLAGKRDEPSNWFMSRTADPFDWFIEADEIVDPDEPVAGNLSPLGELGDSITALIPYYQDQLIFGADSSVWILTGDPLLPDSRFTAITRDIGIVGPRAWAQGQNRVIYFLGSDGLYHMFPNRYNVQQTQRLSLGKLDRTLTSIDYSANLVSLAWDVIRHGLWIFVTPIDGGDTVHHFWDQRSESFWPDVMPTDMNPRVSHVFDSDKIADRTVLVGSADSFIREFQDNATSDDGQAIDSFVVYPPVVAASPLHNLTLTRLDAILADGSGPVDYEVRAHRSAEAVLTVPARYKGRWTVQKTGVQRSDYRRVDGAAFSIRLGNNRKRETWAVEELNGTFVADGLIRSRTGG